MARDRIRTHIMEPFSYNCIGRFSKGQIMEPLDRRSERTEAEPEARIEASERAESGVSRSRSCCAHESDPDFADLRGIDTVSFALAPAEKSRWTRDAVARRRRRALLSLCLVFFDSRAPNMNRSLASSLVCCAQACASGSFPSLENRFHSARPAVPNILARESRLSLSL